MKYALDIDFIEHRRFASPMSLLLFVVGVMAMGVVAVDYLDAHEELQRVEAQQVRLLRRVRHDAIPRQRENSPVAMAQTDAQSAERIVLQLNLPWDALLHELENLADPGIALLSIESQGQTRMLRLTGEAKTMDDVVAYVTRLRESPKIVAATLSGHEEKQAGAVAVIRFSLDVDWNSRS